MTQSKNLFISRKFGILFRWANQKTFYLSRKHSINLIISFLLFAVTELCRVLFFKTACELPLVYQITMQGPPKKFGPGKRELGFYKYSSRGDSFKPDLWGGLVLAEEEDLTWWEFVSYHKFPLGNTKKMAEQTLEKTSKCVCSSTSNPAKTVEKSSNSVASSASNPSYAMALPSKGKQKRNKYAFVCSLLASMTSILLGYGEVFWVLHLSILRRSRLFFFFFFQVLPLYFLRNRIF